MKALEKANRMVDQTRQKKISWRPHLAAHEGVGFEARRQSLHAQTRPCPPMSSRPVFPILRYSHLYLKRVSVESATYTNCSAYPSEVSARLLGKSENKQKQDLLYISHEQLEVREVQLDLGIRVVFELDVVDPAQVARSLAQTILHLLAWG